MGVKDGKLQRGVASERASERGREGGREGGRDGRKMEGAGERGRRLLDGLRRGEGWSEGRDGLEAISGFATRGDAQ